MGGYGLGAALSRLMITLIKLLTLLVQFFFFTAIGRWTFGALLVIGGLWWTLGVHSIDYASAQLPYGINYTITCHSGPISCIDGADAGRYFIDARDYTQQPLPPKFPPQGSSIIPDTILALPEPIFASDGFHGFGYRVESFTGDDTSYESDEYRSTDYPYRGHAAAWIGVLPLLLGGLWLLGLISWAIWARASFEQARRRAFTVERTGERNNGMMPHDFDRLNREPPNFGPRVRQALPKLPRRPNRALAAVLVGAVLFFLVACPLVYLATTVWSGQSSDQVPLSGFFAVMLVTSPLWASFLILVARFIFHVTQRNPYTELISPQQQRAAEENQHVRDAHYRAVMRVPDMIASAGVVGAEISGNLPWAAQHWLYLPANELAMHGIVIGANGSGKTISLLRFAYIAASCYEYRVFFLDAKGDRATAALFVAMMRSAGRQPRMFPREPFDGWEGDGNAIFNRLMAIESFSEAYYKSVTKHVLNLICSHKDGPPRSSADFLSRFNDDLQNRAKLPQRELAGVELRYRAFFGALGGKLDSGWSWEDCESAYILLDGLSLKEEAASLGRYLIEDFAHYAASRKKPGRDLLIIDEYSALATQGTDAANLVERLRSYDCAVVLSSQSYAGLGEPQDAERILDAANWLLVHRTAAPERLMVRAGTERRLQERFQFGATTADIGDVRGNISMEEEPAIHPDEARRLDIGEAILVAHGRYCKALMVRPPMPNQEAVDQARAWIDERPAPPAVLPAPEVQPGQVQPQAQKRIEL